MSDDDIDDAFDDDDFADGGFDDLNDDTNTLGDLWRNNPLVKIGVILLGLAFLVGGIILFGGKSDPVDVSKMRGARDVSEAPGSSEISESMRQAIEEENTRRVEDAQRTGESAVPMPVEPPKGTIGLQIEEEDREDPLERWRRMQERRIKEQQMEPQIEPEVEPPPPPPDTKTPAVNALAEAMSAQMGSILSNQEIRGSQTVNIASLSYLEQLQQQEQARLEAELMEAQALSEELTEEEEEDYAIILPAGSIEYAQILTAVSTDAPGPVLAQIVSGPLQGARAIGTFDVTYNYLVLNFDTFVLDGVDYRAEAVALDTKTTLPGVVTNIDRRYLTRVILPAAAEFVEGFADALARSGQTTLSVTGDTVTETSSTEDIDVGEAFASGVSEAGERFADTYEDIANNTEQLLEVAPGTPIGILFVEPVIDRPNVNRLRDSERNSAAQAESLARWRALQEQRMNTGNFGDIVPISGN
ncbi:MAG: type IV secretion protein DotG [Pseudomonadota bacterium]